MVADTILHADAARYDRVFSLREEYSVPTCQLSMGTEYAADGTGMFLLVILTLDIPAMNSAVLNTIIT